MLEHKGSLASFFLFLGLISIDQVSKIFVFQFFPRWVTCNPGGSWGVPISAPILILVTIGILVGMISIQWKQRGSVLAFVFIISGGVGNLIDRLMNGCVIDFISVASFPLFNIADILLSLGCIFLLLSWYNERTRDVSH